MNVNNSSVLQPSPRIAESVANGVKWGHTAVSEYLIDKERGFDVVVSGVDCIGAKLVSTWITTLRHNAIGIEEGFPGDPLPFVLLGIRVCHIGELIRRSPFSQSAERLDIVLVIDEGEMPEMIRAVSHRQCVLIADSAQSAGIILNCLISGILLPGLICVDIEDFVDALSGRVIRIVATRADSLEDLLIRLKGRMAAVDPPGGLQIAAALFLTSTEGFHEVSLDKVCSSVDYLNQGRRMKSTESPLVTFGPSPVHDDLFRGVVFFKMT